MSNQGYILTKETVLHEDAILTANGVILDTKGFAMVVVQIEGIDGDTVTFEVTVDGDNWYGLFGENITNGIWALTATADGIYHVPVLGKNYFRARLTRVSGTVTITTILTTVIIGGMIAIETLILGGIEDLKNL